jgi:hypothetical protein
MGEKGGEREREGGLLLETQNILTGSGYETLKPKLDRPTDIPGSGLSQRRQVSPLMAAPANGRCPKSSTGEDDAMR